MGSPPKKVSRLEKKGQLKASQRDPMLESLGEQPFSTAPVPSRLEKKGQLKAPQRDPMLESLGAQPFSTAPVSLYDEEDTELIPFETLSKTAVQTNTTAEPITTITAEPQLRNFMKEITQFVPTSVYLKYLAKSTRASSPKIDAEKASSLL